MKPAEYICYDGPGLAELSRGKEVNSGEVLACALQMADLLNPEINTIIEIFPEPLVPGNNAGRYGAEAPLLQLARQLEQAAPWPLTAPLFEQR